jgi:hypothetical protein
MEQLQLGEREIRKWQQKKKKKKSNQINSTLLTSAFLSRQADFLDIYYSTKPKAISFGFFL